MKQSQALDILKLGHNVFLTGAAGSGKTYVLNEYINFLKKHGAAVGITASTGIAATHIGGLTIHSWSGLGVRDMLQDRELKELLDKSYLRKRFDRTKILIIDEVSMLHPFQLDMVDRICRAFKQDSLPFGGMQVVLSGDLFQLPPISKNGETTNYINQSQAWHETNFNVCYLSEQYRHDDDILTDILNDIRNNNSGEHTLKELRKRYRKELPGVITPTKLYTHNIDVDRINNKELRALAGTSQVYDMKSRGNKALVGFLKKSCLAPEVLRLKKGAAVMFVKNNFESGYVNGTVGVVVDFDSSFPVVKTHERKTILVSPEDWVIEEEGKIKAKISQVPLRLAWAITVHKSQGMTLDIAEIDLSKSFVPGMGYVALSRIRSLEGLRLMGLNKTALEVDERVLALDKELRKMSHRSATNLNAATPWEKSKIQKEFLYVIAPPGGKKQKISTLDATKTLLHEKLPIPEIAVRRGLTEGTIIGHIERLFARGDRLDLEYIKPQTKRSNVIKAAFKRTADTRLAPVKALLGDDFSYDELRFVRLFLDT